MICAESHAVPLDALAHRQVRKAAAMPFIYRWIARMPDVHAGIGATTGSLIPTKGAIILATQAVTKS
jgi:tRNA-splicing ligase RtcB